MKTVYATYTVLASIEVDDSLTEDEIAEKVAEYAKDHDFYDYCNDIEWGFQ